ncbi:PREDICTED: putative F-box protein PP2-B12 [Camelina sativa]|uniref:F-box protein PP2-B12 n=1 Tax=Camelina sativa TaxID=90675 RepID=A0ABM0Y0P3_CAMSA|nr:PREDICTED: putative F-box protein PP2-B12 [Camelina sativa]
MGMNFLDLPEECIAVVISFTSPYDICRLSAVSKLLRSIADSDAAWERFLPSYSRMYINNTLSSFSNKKLFLCLCESPLLIGDGRMSFWMEKRSGKKCWMLSARKLEITWVDSREFWIWMSTPDSRFKEVAGLLAVCWFEIRGKISTSLLSKATIYGAYLVFKEQEMRAFGFESLPLDVSFRSTRTDVYNDRRVLLESGMQESREDGWLEIELGEYYVGFNEEDLEMSVSETREGGWKGGIIVQGIEIRPKEVL